MRLGRPSLVLALVVPTVTGCGLLEGGSTVDDAFEALPADAVTVSFVDRGAMAERLDVEGTDPREVSDADVDDYGRLFQDEESAVAATALDPYLRDMKDAPINAFDVEWEARVFWGAGDSAAGATVWKVGDDLDFEALAADLEGKGYGASSAGDLTVYSIDAAESDEITATVGGTYPAPLMLNVLLDEDEEVVAAGTTPEALEDLAAVIADDSDSLADAGSMDDLLETAEDDPELAWMTTAEASVCIGSGPGFPEELADQYDGLGVPEARALFVAGDDADVLLALQFASADAAEDDLEEREALIEDGLDLRSQRPFDDLGDFSVDQDGEFVLIEEDFDGGARQATVAESASSGPGVCLAEDAG
ncbi:hypothetical protein [Nocardioides bizhenqiangii]|uniref:DUF3352 domain-containing protein n=1 Tax=Nocardioides bizhenqiangii TaxID=3095076 RepID=A0ABZ0ZUK6_9ACTN|nr:MULTISPECIES: hypothetical protein [unclassified Nocardioides]MDZ5621806.1 hypothetical protein [Nocardioides sp. HM23]WQQ27509.1 hypothetical protein SHK19_04580 [Nocardioides sp. HM61]